MIGNQTDRAARTYLAEIGAKKGDLSRFVEEAVRRHLVFLAGDRAFRGGVSALDQVVQEAMDQPSAFMQRSRLSSKGAQSKATVSARRPSAVKRPR